MQSRIGRTLVLLLGCLGGCGSTTTVILTGHDMSTGNPNDQPDLSMPGGDQPDLSMPGGGGPDMAGCKGPSTLHPPKMGTNMTVYCPFSGVNGGPAQYCTAMTQHCCEPSMGSAMCQPIATACAAGETDWQCEDPVADCGAGMDCCGAGATLVVDNVCGSFARTFHGSTCVAAGSCTGIQLCTSDSECPTGKTCVPFRSKGNQVGGCN
jgi:hypothetical protein